MDQLADFFSHGSNALQRKNGTIQNKLLKVLRNVYENLIWFEIFWNMYVDLLEEWQENERKANFILNWFDTENLKFFPVG